MASSPVTRIGFVVVVGLALAWTAVISPALRAEQVAAWTAEGDQSNAWFGETVATAGDVNGDGYADVIVGAYEYDNGQLNEGRVFVYHGSASGLGAEPAWTAEGNKAFDWFGASVASAGDVNGDGYSDVIIGASRYTNGEPAEGRALVYHGSPSGLGLQAWMVESNLTDSYFGASVAGAGDINADGYDDVIVGAPYNPIAPVQQNRVYVYFGSAGGLATTPAWQVSHNAAASEFGVSVAGAGDVNGDGYADIAVGRPGYPVMTQNDGGRVYVYHGSSAGPAPDPSWLGKIDLTDAGFGRSVSTAGDVNQDGFADLIVGAPGFGQGQQSNEGAAFVYLGSAAGLATSPAWMVQSDQSTAGLGWAVANAGDVDGDHYADLVVGALYYDNGQANEGRIYVYRGSPSGPESTPLWTAEWNQGGANFGYAVATAGDVNGDGASDVIAGARLGSSAQPGEGAARVFHGAVAGAGAVTSLALAKAAGTQVWLAWDPSCVSTDGDYAIYEGALGSFASHAPRFCSTESATTITFEPPAGSAYYLIVPQGAAREGSYGFDSEGNPRPAGAGACMAQQVVVCE